MSDMNLQIKIKAGVEGRKEVGQLADDLIDLAKAGEQQIGDSTANLREGARDTADAVGDLREEAQGAGSAAEQLGQGAEQGAQGIEKVGAEAEESEGAVGNLKESMGKAAAAIAAAGISIAGAFAMVKASIREATEYDTRFRKLEGVIQATGGAAGFTAKEVRAMSRELAQATLGSVKGFEDAAGVLMTFKSVQGETFRHALELTQDLASVMGGDATSAAKQLGKALEDPVLGVTALREAGVSFTPAQVEFIRSLVETGRVAEAQGFILEQVAAQVGGVARNMAGGLAGALDTLSQRAEEFRVKIGAALTPAWQAVVAGLTKAIEWLTDNFDALATAAKIAGAVLGAFVAVRIITAAIALAKYLKDAAAAFTLLRNGALLAAGPLGAAAAVGMTAYELWKRFGPAADEAGAAMKRAAEDARDALDKVSVQTGRALHNVEALLTAAKTAIDTAAQGATKAARDLAAAWSESLNQQVRDTDTAMRDRLVAIENSAASEREKIRETTQAHVDAAREKVRAADNAGRDMMQAWKAAYDAAREAARASGSSTVELERQATEDRKRILDTLAGHYRSVVDQMISETNRHLDAARRADEELARFKMSTEDRIRSLRQRGMSEAEAYQDRLRQIEEKQSAAREALQKGDFDRAKQLAEQAISLAESNARQVTQTVQQNGKSVTQTIVSEAQASSKAIESIGEASKLVEAAIKGQGDAHRNAATQAASAYEDVKRKLADVQGEMDKLAAGKVKDLTVNLKANIDEVTRRLEEVEQLAKAKELLLAVKLDVDAARRELEAAANGEPISIEAQAKIDKAEESMKRLRDAQQNDPLELLAKIDIAPANAAIAELKKATDSRHTVNPDTARAQAEIRALQRNTSSTHTVYVRKVELNATGGMIGDLVDRFASGGMTFRRKRPGMLFGPGTGTSDSIPAMLSAGEYIVKAASVRKYGRAFLDAVNAGFYLPSMPRFAAGGLVGMAPSASAARGDTMNINLTMGGQRIQLSGARDQAMALAGALRELSRGA